MQIMASPENCQKGLIKLNKLDCYKTCKLICCEHHNHSCINCIRSQTLFFFIKNCIYNCIHYLKPWQYHCQFVIPSICVWIQVKMDINFSHHIKQPFVLSLFQKTNHFIVFQYKCLNQKWNFHTKIWQQITTTI